MMYSIILYHTLPGAPISLACTPSVACGSGCCEGLELVRRPEFERDVAAALYTAQVEWRDRMRAELARAVDVWLDDTIQLTAKHFDTTAMR